MITLERAMKKRTDTKKEANINKSRNFARSNG